MPAAAAPPPRDREVSERGAAEGRERCGEGEADRGRVADGREREGAPDGGCRPGRPPRAKPGQPLPCGGQETRQANPIRRDRGGGTAGRPPPGDEDLVQGRVRGA